jgi:4-hydroxybenzoyl-CoA thioesterase
MKIELPDTFQFETEIPIRISDINYGGHLGNDAVLSVIHEARVQFLKTKGFTESDVGGCGIILSDAAIVYASEAFHGETLVVEVTPGEWARTSCDLLYLLTDKKSGREVARARTLVVFYDYARKRPVKAPEAFAEAFLS